MLIGLLLESPLVFLLVSIPLIYAIVLHEVAHAVSAYVLGDRAQKWYGRMSLNPLRHLDPIGTISLLVFGFGWAKPVPVNYLSLRGGNRGIAFVSASGIIMNLLLAFFALSIQRTFSGAFGTTLDLVLSYFAQINIILASFNLIPIPPLDGSKIFMPFFSRSLRYNLMRMEPYGIYIIIGLLVLGILDPLTYAIRKVLTGLVGALLP